MTGRSGWRDAALAKSIRRIELKLTQRQMAERLGIGVVMFAQLERGARCPSVRFEREWDAALYREVP